jgi:hypothetical protein
MPNCIALVIDGNLIFANPLKKKTLLLPVERVLLHKGRFSKNYGIDNGIEKSIS